MSQASVEIGRGTRIAVPRLSERAGQRRSLDQRLFVRFPALYRLLADGFLRLPLRSRFRRVMLAGFMARIYAAANRRDFEVVLLGWHPESEYRPSTELMPPDLEPVFQGHEGYLRLWRYWLDAFEDIRWDPEEMLDFGAKLLVTTKQRGHGSGSGVSVSEPVFQLLHSDEAWLSGRTDFLDRSEALEAVGLSE